MHSTSVFSSARTLNLCLFFVAVVFMYMLQFKLPFSPFYNETVVDQLTFLYDADRMMQGQHIYRDFFQFTFPGCQVFYLLLFGIFGTSFWLLPFATLLIGAGSFWLLLLASRQIVGGTYAYLPPILFTFFGFRWFGLDGSHRVFSALFVLIAVLSLLKGRSLRHIVAAGFFCAAASFFTQQRGFVALAAIGSFVVVDNLYRGWRWRPAVIELAALVGTYIFALTALCAYFVATTGFDAFVNSTLVYPTLYYGYDDQNNYSIFFASLLKAINVVGVGPTFAIIPSLFYSFCIPIILTVFIIVFCRKRREHEWDLWRGPALVALVTAFLIFTTPNPNFWRLYQISALPLILLAWLLRYFDPFAKGKPFVVALSAFLLICSAFQAYRMQASWDYVKIDAPRGVVYAQSTDEIQRYLWLQQHTRPGDPVFEIYPHVYFLLGLRNPSRFSQILPNNYTRPEFVTGTVEDLMKDPPLFIIWDNFYNKPDAERSPDDHIGPLADFVQAQYAPTGPIYNKPGEDTVQIWERKVAEH